MKELVKEIGQLFDCFQFVIENHDYITSTELIYGFTLVTISVGTGSHTQVGRKIGNY
jgi:hypothetical protein